MNFANMPLEQLESLHADLGEYLAVRRQYEAVGRVQELETTRRQMTLELDEARAQLAAQTEMAGRLLASLKLSPAVNGHNGVHAAVDRPQPATEPAQKTGRKPKSQIRPASEDAALVSEQADPAEDALAFNENLSASGALTLDDLALDFGDEW